MTHVEHTTVEPSRLDIAVAGLLEGFSRSRSAQLVRDGYVTVDGDEVTKPSHRLKGGERVVVDVPPPRPAEAVAQDLPLSIVHEDADIVVVDKAAGMVVHPGPGHPDGTLVNALLHHVGDLSGIGGVERPGIVHRLDRSTSGLLVVAKHDIAHQRLSEQFRDHSAQRTYLAFTHGAPGLSSGTIRSRLARHPKDRIRFASVKRGSGGKRAVTHWERVGAGRGLGLVRCKLETGRTHQIRVHLTEQGWPLVGDHLYKRRGATTPSWLADLVPDHGRAFLHAWRLELDHPADGRRMLFKTDLATDFATALERAGIPAPEDDPLAGIPRL